MVVIRRCAFDGPITSTFPWNLIGRRVSLVVSEAVVSEAVNDCFGASCQEGVQKTLRAYTPVFVFGLDFLAFFFRPSGIIFSMTETTSPNELIITDKNHY